MKLGPGEPCAVERECQPTIIRVAKNRRLQNIGRFVVETFETGLKKLRLGLIAKVTGPTTPGMSLGARNTNGPFCTAGGAGGGLLSTENCAPKKENMSDRR